MKKVLLFLIFISCFIIPSMKLSAKSLYPEKDKYVIVIDPGHGGENFGTNANDNYLEKDILMTTAMALVEELEKYDAFEVYLTRTEDVDISLRDRAVFAKSVNADFLFSLHYNASENHTLFGTEVWIPLKAPYHSMGYQFAYLQQLQMQELGLFSRGIRTRKNDENTDYYGILRECVARNIPAVIIEHCHIDEERDASFCDEEQDFIEFGRRDAIAIAKYFGVHEELSDIPEELYNIKKNDTISWTYQDFSGPNICKIEEEYADYENGVLTVNVKAKEKQTAVMYYTYSLDGGKSFSKMIPWPGADLVKNQGDESFSLMISIPEGCIPKLIVRAYNKYEIYRSSNTLKGFEAFVSPTAPPAIIAPFKEFPVVYEEETKPEPVFYEILNMEPETFKISLKRFILLLVFIFFWTLSLFVLGRYIYRVIKERSQK